MNASMKKQLPIFAAFLLVSMITAGGAAWYVKPQQVVVSKGEPAPVLQNYKYLSLERVIVMLRAEESGPMAHYASIDLVFKTDAEHEKAAKQQLPMLRSVAVQSLSQYTFERMSKMSIEQLTLAVNEAYRDSYRREGAKQPFSEVMIGKLIVE